eukprot:5385433-Lingulodinium_polyedra.AAC.1
MMGIIRAAVEKLLLDINAPVPPKTELPGTTARTLLGGLKYVARHMPPVVIIENVTKVEAILDMLA